MASVRALLSTIGDTCDLNSREIEVLSVLLEAFEKYRSQDAKYRGLWKRGGTEDSLMHMTSKFERINQDGLLPAKERRDMDHDDHLDLVCYTVFYIINQRAGRFIRPGRGNALEQLKLLGLELVVDRETPPGEVRIMDGNECVGSVLLG